MRINKLNLVMLFVILALTAAMLVNAAEQTTAPISALHWRWDTALVCLLGWLLHWTLAWGEEWKKGRVSVLDYAWRSPPAFLSSLLGTLLAYLLLPDMVPLLGFSSGMLASAVIGVAGDAVIPRIINLARPGQ